MKRLVLIISAILSLVTLQAQTSDGYLTDGDIVSISVEISESELNRYYLEASADGILTQSYATANCLWVLGISQNNGAYHYTLKDLTSDKYIYINANPSNPTYSLQNTATTFTLEREAGAQGTYETGKLYYRFYYSPWNSWQTVYFAQGGWWPFRFTLSTGNEVTVQIEKWNKEGADTPGGGFYPETLIFPYASNDSEAQAQEQEVTFTIPETAVVSYQCVNRPDEIIGGGQNDVDEGDITDFRLYWESSSTTTSEIKQSNYYTPNPSDGYVLPADGTDMLTLTEGASAGTNKTHTFTITPVGESPMNLRTNTNNRTQWVNYADRVVAEYKYKGNTVKQTMRVVRNSYHEEPLPPLTFHINPTMFTFGAKEETVNITVVPIHQHGSVIYDVNQNVFQTEYEPHDPAYPERLSLTSPTDGWVITTDDGADWLEHTMDGNTIAITAEELGDGQDRTATFTGTFKRENAGSGHQHQESFTIQLAQRSDAGIQFVKKNQEVHTATRTIYYLPEDKIELRLAESNFFGYMRWYDYHTGKAPNYNFGNNDTTYGDYNYATSWYTTPRGANNRPFTPINTPASAATESDEGRSWGLYAINHHHGGILNEGTENSNNIPVLNGWNYTYAKGATYSTEQAKRAAGYHTIACDVSAYTDYEITTEGGVVKSITEPTLSYRQLFDLRPAGEMADTLAARTSRGVYLEEYKYQAPAGKNILLTPQFKYRKGTNDEYLSKLCYFYWNGNNLVRVTNATWEGNGKIADNGEYLTVSGNAGETKTYTLTANDGAVLIAKFTVTFTNPQETGPSRTVLKSDYEMTNIYSRKAHIDFNYTDDNKKTTLSDGFTYYNQPLNAAESTYGFVYTQGDLAQTASNDHHGFVRAANQGVFPFYGEYVLVNGVNKSWGDARISAENHGGKDKGFALYVDGTTEPGLVVSISAPANICSGQTMYCSAWLCNPSNAAHQGSNPIFRFNVQGRKTGQTEWEDAGVFFVGELPKGSGWQQVVFPIESAHSYDETRVSLYNFATSGAANDFLVDDISLFVSQLPIAAYQGKMACRSTDAEHSSAAAVLRLDYSNIQAGSDGYIYYQIFNTDLKKAVNLTGDEAYYHEAHQGQHTDDDSYGSVHIPATNYDPEANNETFYYSVSAFLDDLVSKSEKHGKAYVKTTNDNVTKWLLYVAHIIDNVTEEDMNELKTDDERKALALSKLYDAHGYTMRMAYSPLELPQAECNMQTPLHATQQTVFELCNSDGKIIQHKLDTETSQLVANQGDVTNIYTNSVDNCANDLYFLTAKVVNHLAVNTGLTPNNEEAPIYADWLVSPAELDTIFENKEKTQEEKEQAFYDYYGYRPGEVASAVMYDMRRVPTDKDNNTNYNATSFKALNPSKFLNRENYNIVKHLHDNGWLQFRDTTIHFYLPSDAVASYWCFPIEGTAKKTINDKEGNPIEITLKDCNEPRRIRVTSASSDHMLNIAPMTNAKKTSVQKTQIPLVKVLANQLTNVEIPITESENIRGVSSGKIIIDLTQSMGTDVTFFDLETGTPINTTPALSPGTEHTIRLLMKNKSGNIHINGEENACRVGYVFATIQILPDTLVWTPAESSFNGWGKDENWKGWNDKNADGVIDNSELTEGYVPISGANVIIPKLANTLLYPYIVPEHTHNHYPMTINFQPHHCNNIYFAPGTHIYNQHLLEYEKAFVDMQFPAAKWHLVSAPLQGMVSGDMFVPHNGWYDEKQDKRVAEPNPFEVKAFNGDGYTGIRSGDAAYAFWQAFYNTTTEGNTLLRNLADLQFTQSNTLVQPLTEGTGYAVYGLGFNETDSLTIRLPKPDQQYDYYTNGSPNGTTVDIPYTVEQRGKLAYTATHNNQQMTITLTNQNSGEYFLFGNPTMAFVDMHALYLDNKDQWNGEFKTMTNNIINAATPATLTPANRYLPPMTSALLKASSEGTQMNITLLPSHLTLNNVINPVDEVKKGENDSQQAPARRVAGIDERPVNYEALQSQLMTIYAFTPKGTARTVLATNPAANDYYTSGEDALFTSSGVENESYVTTPLNMYTVAEQVPMMADVRQGISEIPLAILAADKARAEHMQIAFYLSSNWSRECYFYDSQTGQRIRIMDGLVITIEMPQNHEQRYYIEGPDVYQGSSQGGVTTSTPANNTTTNPNLRAYSLHQGEVTVTASELMTGVKLYDIAGRLLAHETFDLLQNTATLSAPAGVCVVEAVLRDGTTLHTQTIVR